MLFPILKKRSNFNKRRLIKTLVEIKNVEKEKRKTEILAHENTIGKLKRDIARLRIQTIPATLRLLRQEKVTLAKLKTAKPLFKRKMVKNAKKDVIRLRKLPIHTIKTVSNGNISKIMVVTKPLKIDKLRTDFSNRDEDERKDLIRKAKKYVGKKIGSFLIMFTFKDGKSTGLKIFNLKYIADNTYYHPCISVDNSCLGNMANRYSNFRADGKFYTMVELLIDFIVSPTLGDSPYIGWGGWFKRKKKITEERAKSIMRLVNSDEVDVSGAYLRAASTPCFGITRFEASYISEF